MAAADNPAHKLETAPQASVPELVECGRLKPGDLLGPIDPSWVVDAVVTDDSTLLVDGLREFDSLDEATRWLNVST